MQLAELKRFAPAAKHTILSGLMQAWPEAEAAGITTPLRICHFLSQCFVESKGFTVSIRAGPRDFGRRAW
ncbi:hypothetical protein V3589_02455 [Sinorhizobium fredii]|uniref:hypothetical protein n=1 Tax=Rhizobium fredii TaxID=380 RepID=UPI0030A1C069